MKRNKFNMSHTFDLSFRHGKIIPIWIKDILPGDSVRIRLEIFMRLAPLLAPIMTFLRMRIYHFFVPLRLIWDDYDEFFTRGRNNDSVVDVPQIVVNPTTGNAFYNNLMPEYMGIPPTPLSFETISGNHFISALPFRAYQLIYNEFFRNQELQDEVEFSRSSENALEAESVRLATFAQKNWDNDYFTTAKAQALLNPDVNGFAYIEVNDDEDGHDPYYYNEAFWVDGDGDPPSGGGDIVHAPTTGTLSNGSTAGTIKNVNFDNLGISIESLRVASAMTRWVETIIRVGYRYKEYLMGIWQQKSSDLRLELPEYLGGQTLPVRISEVLNMTDANVNNTPLGTQAGHGIASGGGGYIKSSFNEHGYYMVLMCVTPRASYAQGIPEHFMKRDHLDWANPFLANLGMQETPLSQIYYDWTVSQSTNRINFGYKNRYAEYKTEVNRYAGEFRDTLSFWLFGNREFASAPTLNGNFVQCYPGEDIFAVETGDHYFASIYFDISMLRKLPYFSVPKID